MKKLILLISVLFIFGTGQAQNKLTINTDKGVYKINKHIYGHFSEHLGHCIYGGIWVGKDSPIPNIDGYRKDVFEALKAIKIPNLRWPGGCFADEYHWKDGLGDPLQRPTMINTHWGGVTEDNSFGTHEFLNYCELLGTEPYVCGNVGSGTVDEMSKWVEYINFGGVSPMSNLRKENGREQPWKVKYWGVGNENWGCGGNMTAEYYADLYKRFATYCRNYGDNNLYKIAGGASSTDYNWTEVLMKKVPHWLMDGISLHHYTIVNNWEHKGSATEFSKEEYMKAMINSAFMDELLAKHKAIMDKYDPDKKISLVVDEWGIWHDVEEGTNPGFLYQQNTLRDAFIAGITLNAFNNHADRVAIANLAQTVNVLQALVLTKEDKMILTPTYHVFDMYQAHKDATLLESKVESEKYKEGEQEINALNISSSIAEDGTVTISIVNVHPDKDMKLTCDLIGETTFKTVTGKVLTAEALNTHNTFENPDQVKIVAFDGAKLKKNQVSLTVPKKSIVVLSIK